MTPPPELANLLFARGPWSVAQVRTWAIERGEQDGDVAVFVAGPFGRECVSFRDRITSHFTGYAGWSLEEHAIAGRPLSRAAVGHLSPRLLTAIQDVQNEEKAAGETAVAKLVAAGGTLENAAGAAWKVKYKEGSFYIWGNVDGSNRLSGFITPGTTWMESTVEEFLLANKGT